MAFIWPQTGFLASLPCPVTLMCVPRGAPGHLLRAQPGFTSSTSLKLITQDLTSRWQPSRRHTDLLPMYANHPHLESSSLFFPYHDNGVHFLNALLFISYCIRITAPLFFFFLPAVTALSWFIEESILFSVPRRSNQSTIAVLYLGLLEGAAYSPPGQLNVFKCIFR